MKDESQGGDTCKGCPPQPEHKGGQDPPDPPMIYATVFQSSLRPFVGLQLFLTAEFVRWRHLHCSMICHHLLWCGQAPLPISVNENGGAYVSVPKADVYAI